MSLKSLEQRKLLGSLKSTDKELASTNRKHKKLNLLITKLRGAFVCAPACVTKNFLVKSRNCVSVRVKKTKISDKKISGLNVQLIAVATWSTKQHCTKRQLQFLIGKPNYIYTVCRHGRTFLYRAHHLVHHLRLNHVFHKDLLWLRIFLPSWNGRSFFFDDK